ncbi:hypothetical protein [Alcaligenes aquatilis]|uniref:hypothetical protein n=1 Tax=Alcaligenes aquatilis TaxID=323284 RepID=UPI003621F7B2
MIAKPSQAKPSQAKPSQAKPSQAKPSQAKPSQAQQKLGPVFIKKARLLKMGGLFYGRANQA